MSFFDWLFRRKKKKPLSRDAAPAAQVPADVPVPPRKVLSGLSFYCGWRNPAPEFGAVPGVQTRALNPWTTIEADDRHLLRGEYDEADPAITLAYIEDCKRGGFDFAILQIEHAHEHAIPRKRASHRPVLNDPLLMTHVADNWPIGSGVRFGLAWWDSSATENVWRKDTFWQELIGNTWNGDDVRASQQTFMRSVATRYMTHPDYLHLGGKPVFVRGHPQELQFYNDHFGVSPEEIVAIWQVEAGKAIGTNLHLMATASSLEVRPMLKPWGFNGFFDYLLHGKGWENTMDVYRHHRALNLAQCRKEGLQYWMPGTFGYDGRAENTPESQAGFSHLPTPAQLTKHAREVRKAAVDNADVTGAVAIWYAYNEIREGGIAAPMKMDGKQLHSGYEMLDAHKAA